VSELVLLGIAAVILAGGGIMHVYASNKEIEVARKIDATKKEIEEHYADVNMTEVKMDRHLDRYLMKEELLARGSELRETKPNQLEMVEPGVDGTTDPGGIAAITEIARDGLAP